MKHTPLQRHTSPLSPTTTVANITKRLQLIYYVKSVQKFVILLPSAATCTRTLECMLSTIRHKTTGAYFFTV